MRSFGGFVVALGVIGALIAFSLDTSVSTGFGRVNNIGLMNDKQNYIMVAIGILIIGVLMTLFGKPTKVIEAINSPDATINSDSRACPFCAETIKAKATICRFCQKDVEPVISVAAKQEEDDESQFIATGVLSEKQQASMREFEIIFDGEKFHLGDYRYDKLSDALDYANRQSR